MLSGLLTAMVTPFDAQGRVDERRAVEIGRYLLDHGSTGLVVAGTTGEASTLTDEEQLSLIAAVAGELRGPDCTIVAGASSNDTRHAIHLTERAVEIGVDAVLSATPYYNRPNRRGILAHFGEVARAAGGTPVVLYNIPSRTATDMPNDLLAELAQIEGIEAVKQSNTANLAPVDGLALLAGNDSDLLATMELGGQGGICVSSHIVGPQMRRIVDEPDARAEVDASLRDVYDAIFLTSSPTPVKTALRLIGQDCGGFRLPMVEATPEEEAEIRTVLERHGLLKTAAR